MDSGSVSDIVKHVYFIHVYFCEAMDSIIAYGYQLSFAGSLYNI